MKTKTKTKTTKKEQHCIDVLRALNLVAMVAKNGKGKHRTAVFLDHAVRKAESINLFQAISRAFELATGEKASEWIKEAP